MKIDSYEFGKWNLGSHDINWLEGQDQNEFMEKEMYDEGVRIGGGNFEPHAIFYNHRNEKHCLVDIYLDESLCYLIMIEEPASRLHFLKEYVPVFEKKKADFVPYGGFSPHGYLHKKNIHNVEILRGTDSFNLLAITNNNESFMLLKNQTRINIDNFMNEYFDIPDQ